MDLNTRIFIGTACVAFLVVYFVLRWRRASAHVAAREQFQARGQQNFLALKQHACAQTLLPKLAQRYRVTWDAPTDPESYRIVWLALLDDRATCHRVEDIGRATMLVAYLGRDTSPKQLMVSMTLASGELHETVPPFGWTLQAPE